MNKTKIIVVEDNIVYCEYVCNMLSREGYRNMKAYHLSTAKKHLQQATDNDIVVADLRLPDGSGIDLNNCGGRQHRVLRICLQYAVTGGLPQYEGLPPLNREETSATGNR